MSQTETVQSPGMKYKHYAPETKCVLINCANELDQLFDLNRYIKQYGSNAVVIGFEEHADKVVLPDGYFLVVSKKNDLEEYAKNIYSLLRKADEIKPKIILIEGVPKEGIGYAIMNRLIRTCGYDIVEK